MEKMRALGVAVVLAAVWSFALVQLAEAGEWVCDDRDACTSSTGSWKESGASDEHDGDSVYSKESGVNTYTFTAQGFKGGCNIDIWWTYYASRCQNVQVEVRDGSALLHTASFDQRDLAETGCGAFGDLYDGTFSDVPNVIVYHTEGSGCSTSADAVKFVCDAVPGEPISARPIWQITQDGTGDSVPWVDHAPNPRFAVYDGGTPGSVEDDIVLDRETGLVWEREPESVTGLDPGDNWYEAVDLCFNSFLYGRRRGWRLPTAAELGSLLTDQDPDNLPTGHPFIGVGFPVEWFWTSTTAPQSPTEAYSWYLGYLTPLIARPKTEGHYYWCVRGGQGHDAY